MCCCLHGCSREGDISEPGHNFFVTPQHDSLYHSFWWQVVGYLTLWTLLASPAENRCERIIFPPAPHVLWTSSIAGNWPHDEAAPRRCKQGRPHQCDELGARGNCQHHDSNAHEQEVRKHYVNSISTRIYDRYYLYLIGITSFIHVG